MYNKYIFPKCRIYFYYIYILYLLWSTVKSFFHKMVIKGTKEKHIYFTIILQNIYVLFLHAYLYIYKSQNLTLLIHTNKIYFS